MKKIVVLALIPLILIINVYANDVYLSNLCVSLLESRSQTWDLIYDDRKDVDDFIDAIGKYEIGVLLCEDIFNFQEMRKEVTELEPIEIVSFQVKNFVEESNTIQVEGEQIAIMKKLDGTTESIVTNQKMELKKINEVWYLKSIEVLAE